MKVYTTLLTLNTPNRNGHIFTEEAVKNAIEKHKGSNRLFVTRNLPDDVGTNLGDAIALVTDMEIKDNAVMGNVEFLNTPQCLPQFEDMLQTGIAAVRPNGRGNVGEDGHISNYLIESFTLICDKK